MGEQPGEVDEKRAEQHRRIEASLRAGIELEGMIAQAGQEIRERSKEAYGQTLLDARMVLMGLATEVAALRQGEAGQTDEALSQRLALVAGALQGAGATETLISEGQYLKAAAALRQDLELLARLRELDEGSAQVGKVANMRSAPTGSGPVYGYLSGVAHVAKPDVVDALLARQEVAPGAVGVAIIPHFVEDTAVGLYEIHVWESIALVREMALLHVDVYGEQEQESLGNVLVRWDDVVQQLLDAGHLRAAPDTP